MTVTHTAGYRYAKERAGYGDVDTPCEPRRSAYTDDPVGTGAYLAAVQRWHLFLALLDSRYESLRARTV